MISAIPIGSTPNPLPGRAVALCLLLFGTLSLITPARAEDGSTQQFDIAAGDAEAALKTFAAQSGCQVLAPTALVTGLRTREVRGSFTPQAALNRMLADTPVTAVAGDATTAFALVQRPNERQETRELNAAACIVIGLFVDEAQGQRFRRCANAVRDALLTRGVPLAEIQVVPPSGAGLPRRDAILEALRKVKPEVEETWLIVLGQARPGRDGAPMFQVSGPRLSAEDLTAAVAAMPGKKYVVLGMSGSGAFLQPLLNVADIEAVAATAEAGEINEPRFPVLWAEALAANPDASFRELALDASSRVAAFYREHALGQGEHAQLLDQTTGKIISAPFAETP